MRVARCGGNRCAPGLRRPPRGRPGGRVRAIMLWKEAWLDVKPRGRDPPRNRDIPMINGVHTLIYSKNADAIRAFFRDVLQLHSVDAGHGWLIFALPPAEIAAHPANSEKDTHELYLMCDDLDATVADLKAKGVEVTQPIKVERWGRVTEIKVAPGSQIGLYQPEHPTAIGATGKAIPDAR